MKQFFACNQRQNRISQKLQLLVVVDSVFALACLLRLLLARLRAVSERLLDHRPPAEMVAQRRFQRGDFPFLHDDSNPLVTCKRSLRGEGSGRAARRVACFAAPYLRVWLASLNTAQFFAGGAPPVSCVRRSLSLRAASPLVVPSFV